VANDSVLFRACGAPVVSRFDTGFATSGTTSQSADEKFCLRFGAGGKFGVTDATRLRI
jgi:hypothetical protein